MSFFPTEDELYTRAIQLLGAAAAAAGFVWDMSDKGYHGLKARAWAQLTMLYIKSASDAYDNSVPAYKQDADGTLLSKLSTDALDAWAITLGLPSGTPGVYGRKGAVISTGGAGIPVCSINGTTITAGALLVDTTGAVSFQTTTSITTDGPPNTQVVTVESITTGVAARIPAGAILSFVAPPSGVQVGLVLTSGLVQGGADRESDGDLLQRILFKLQNPGRGGTAADYRYWTENSTDASGKFLGIRRGHTFPLRSGTGTVDEMPLVAGSGKNRDPGALIAAAVQVALNILRPVTAKVNVIRPYMASTNALRVKVNLVTYLKYKPDWVDGGNGYGITGSNAGAKTLTCTLPTNLTSAVDAGAKPRIQIIISTAGAGAAPFQARVLSYNVGAGTVTLDTFPPIAPTSGVDYFYAGGPYVDVIAAALAAYVDGLGPSRQSGFADEFDVWETDVTPARIADVVMESRDTDGTRMIRDIPNLGSIGVLIAVGAGSFAPTGYYPRDVTGNCELCYLRNGGIEILATL